MSKPTAHSACGASTVTAATRRWCFQEIKPVGYHAWVDADRLVLFVLGKPSTLQTAQVATGKGTVVASDVGRSILRMPGGNSISFVERLETGEHWVKELNPMTGASTPLVIAPPGSTERDCAWLPDGTLLCRRAHESWRGGAAIRDGVTSTTGRSTSWAL